MPQWAIIAKSIVDFKGGDLFRNWTVAVIMENPRKKMELEEVRESRQVISEGSSLKFLSGKTSGINDTLRYCTS